MNVQRFKYPRTPHLPWSPGYTADDIRQSDSHGFENKEVVITEKMDGECTTIYRDYIHARSIDSRHHPSRNWVKALQARLASDIPEGWRICGENLYAKHSLFYSDLDSYFYVFAIWDENNRCLSWDELLEWTELCKLHTVPVIHRSMWDERMVRNINVDESRMEGYVVRTAEGFDYSDFSIHFAKWVRPNHVQTDTHWMAQSVVPNKLKPMEGAENE
ncbi:RNA ligase family protein [Hahella ganghwensis]|uniref:RNA ligase family protein n=1 Tax=Hahella ganghwensis TaxID=286420 RepID=UPI0003614344|nr:RNA ligase family protein [Hahella ganghwensis]